MRVSPIASERTVASPSNGRALAVFGRVLVAAPVGAGAGALTAFDDGTDAAAVGRAAAAAGAARVACTSFSVRTCGGIDVMMVAVSRSP